MEPHGIHPRDGRKEITCSDCGHPYLIAQGQRSSRCQICGNIEFLGESIATLTSQIVRQRVIPRLQKNAEPDDPLAAFRLPANGPRVSEICIRYQVEWQLWAVLVRRFRDPEFHMAYFCRSLATNDLEKAAERYREHRSVMVLLAESQWEAEVADLMLAKIEAVAIARLETQKVGFGIDLPEWISLAPWTGNAARIGWGAFGLYFAAKLLHFAP